MADGPAVAGDLTVRQAALADTAAVLSLVRSAYRGPESRRGWTTEADLLDDQRIDEAGVRAKVAAPDGCVLLGEDARGQLLGCCELVRRGRGVAYFGMFAVAPARQNAGLGRAMLEAAQTWARERWAATAVEMTVIAQRSELIAWYERRGYRLTGERRPFPYADLVGGPALRDDLEFVVLRRELDGRPDGGPRAPGVPEVHDHGVGEDAGVRVGSVALLRVFPVRSAGPVQPERVLLDAHGLVGDRRLVVTDADGRVVTGKDLPALAAAAPQVGRGGDVGDVTLPSLDALAVDAGRRLVLAPAPDGSHAGGAAVHLVSVGADLAPDALPLVAAGCDPGERANIVLGLAADVPAGAERSWVGRLLDVGSGGAQLRLTRTPRRCLGVYADVVTGGPVAVGDDVVLRAVGPAR